VRQRTLRQLGKNVRALRLKRTWSQEQLAEASNSHVNYVGGIERGERNPTATKLVAIAVALNVELPDLFTGVSTKKR
jgi:transcriptional regulator with XRE-family HTH domain